MSAWSETVRLTDIPASGMVRDLVADEAARKRLARELDLLALDALEAKVQARPWMDGAEVSGTWSARFAQTCGVTLERLDQALSGEFLVRVVPAGSIHAPSEEDAAEFDPEAVDPPDVSEDGDVDLAGYVVEHFALEIDPFPRKPGAEFTPPDPGPDLSPFAVLKNLKRPD